MAKRWSHNAIVELSRHVALCLKLAKFVVVFRNPLGAAFFLFLASRLGNQLFADRPILGDGIECMQSPNRLQFDCLLHTSSLHRGSRDGTGPRASRQVSLIDQDRIIFDSAIRHFCRSKVKEAAGYQGQFVGLCR